MLTKNDLKQIKNVVKPLISEGITPLKSDIKTLKEDVSKIRRDVAVILDFFDTEYLNLRKRVERIEEHLNLPPVV